MSTVLWANILRSGDIESDESDKYALYRFADKLNRLTKKLEVTSFYSALDHTDIEFEYGEEDLLEGIESTSEMMVKNGFWITADEAVSMLETLINHISSDNVKFGLTSNHADDVLEELNESLEFANKAKQLNAKFNFSVVV